MSQDLINKIVGEITERAEYTSGYLVSDSDIEKAVKEALGDDDSCIFKVFADFTIDSTGRLYLDGQHIGWLRKECGSSTLLDVANKLGTPVPPLIEDFKTLEECS